MPVHYGDLLVCKCQTVPLPRQFIDSLIQFEISGNNFYLCPLRQEFVFISNWPKQNHILGKGKDRGETQRQIIVDLCCQHKVGSAVAPMWNMSHEPVLIGCLNTLFSFK